MYCEYYIYMYSVTYVCVYTHVIYLYLYYHYIIYINGWVSGGKSYPETIGIFPWKKKGAFR